MLITAPIMMSARSRGHAVAADRPGSMRELMF
jgi:hypothetical protein